MLLDDNRIDINIEDDKGNKAIHIAMNNENFEIQKLLKKHSGVVETDKVKILRDFIICGNSLLEFNIMKSLVEEDPDLINSKDERGRSPLHIACIWNRERIVEFFLTLPGIDVNSADKSLSGGWTALNYAVIYGSESLIELLVKYPGIDVNYKDGFGCTALEIIEGNSQDEIKSDKDKIKALFEKYSR